MIIDEELYLEHYGKMGMHWGVRGTRRLQRRIDRVSRVATGQATAKDRLLTGSLLTTKKSAAKSLERGAALQNKVNHGKSKTANMLLNINGIKIKNLDYHQKGVKKGSYKTVGNNKGDAGRRVALGLIGAGLLANAYKNIQ